MICCACRALLFMVLGFFGPLLFASGSSRRLRLHRFLNLCRKLLFLTCFEPILSPQFIPFFDVVLYELFVDKIFVPHEKADVIHQLLRLVPL
jgi:hypothetical protein